MRFVRTGKSRQDTQERLVEINSLEEAQGRFKRMDYLLGFVKEEHPEVVTEYVGNLLARYQDLLNGERRNANPYDLEQLVSDNPNMKEHLELARVTLNYILQVLQLPAETKMGTSKVVNKNYFQSFSHPSYHNLLVLTETIGRAEAIAFYKKFVTSYWHYVRNPNRETYDNLETLFEKATEPKEVPSDWVIVRGMIGDGKYAYRNDNCLWIEAIDDLPDSELKYYVCCYGDYERAKDYHDSIVLTMEHTIAQGDPYCSRVLHDTRVDWDLRHPPKSFWDNMKPENE
ncbi:MAG: L-2-amino-thiazoline-4-carboxylic acid hydrolase [Candidatus Thorarchaeota archaeon]